MSQICLMDFNDDDKFNNYFWESDYIKQINMEGDNPNKFGIEFFEFKKILSTRRVPTKKGLEFVVLIEVISKNDKISWMDDMTEKTEEKAIETFLSLKEELEFFKEKELKGRIFDGRRYFWDVSKEGEPTNRGWN